MSKRNLESSTQQAQVKQVKASNRLPYNQPEVYSLGSLEQVQSGQGKQLDGSDSLYYYYG
jgi:hypothetical protein